jgi:hypothetical protein
MPLVAYEVFSKKLTRTDSPMLALAPNGRIALNAAACRILDDAGVKSVTVLWDADARKLALRGSTGGGDSYALTFTPDRHSASLAAKAFMRHIGWDAKERRVFPAAWNAQKKMLEADLNKDVSQELRRKLAEVFLKKSRASS